MLWGQAVTNGKLVIVPLILRPDPGHTHLIAPTKGFVSPSKIYVSHEMSILLIRVLVFSAF